MARSQPQDEEDRSVNVRAEGAFCFLFECGILDALTSIELGAEIYWPGGIRGWWRVWG
jgi:hypothetical protein